ncbi:hypothetical protein Q1695_014014 [Nippostrongylus brasiliensis]|nr:hypothetical protein Q1695_014014 [Nippostrongylus brasiliensis]
MAISFERSDSVAGKEPDHQPRTCSPRAQLTGDPSRTAACALCVSAGRGTSCAALSPSAVHFNRFNSSLAAPSRTPPAHPQAINDLDEKSAGNLRDQ